MSNIYKKGMHRKQQMFFPPSIDEYVDEDNPVRVIDDYVELLDTAALGFTKAALNSPDGQPAYHPKLLLKIYIYGYLNRIRSSRKLEREIKRNIEMMWLCSGLAPSNKTIANFRKENAKPLKKVFREFVLLCRDLDLITGEVVAVDGAFLRANASKNRLITKKGVEKDLKAIDEKIEHYLTTMAFEDAQEKKERLLQPPVETLSKLKERKNRLDNDLALLEAMGVTQYNRTDPDAKKMIKTAHNLMAYNTQIAVDSTFKFIVATDVSSDGNDHNKLHAMATQTQEAVPNDTMTVVGDTGYYSARELAKCEEAGIEVVVAIPDKEKRQKDRGFYPQSSFVYDAKKDCYLCPNQQILSRSNTVITKNNGTQTFVYRAGSKICKACPLRDKCIPPKTAVKRVMRSEYSEVVTRHQTKMQTPQAKTLIRQRGSMAEHPFGTIKQQLGWSHYLVRGLEKVSGENALIMFTYNFRRLLNLIGIPLFRKLLKALKEGNIEAIKAEIAAYIAHNMEYSFCFYTLMKAFELKEKNLRYAGA